MKIGCRRFRFAIVSDAHWGFLAIFTGAAKESVTLSRTGESLMSHPFPVLPMREFFE
jgi:hypothetical protein